MEKLTGGTTSMMLCTTYEYHLPGARKPGMYQVPGTAGGTTSMMLCTTYEYHLPVARTPGMYQVPGTAVRTKFSYLPYICMMRVPRCHDCYYHGVQQRNALVLCPVSYTHLTLPTIYSV